MPKSKIHNHIVSIILVKSDQNNIAMLHQNLAHKNIYVLEEDSTLEICKGLSNI